ncbi:MAG: hypothetical protein ACRDT5_16115, partial [Mycobacterium sp.]
MTTTTPILDGITVDNRPPLDHAANEQLVASELQRLRNKAEAKRRYDAAENQHTDRDTWAPIDIGPYLRGEITTPTPSIGAVRSDGLRCLYPGREHTAIGETESGKSWFALMCAIPEMLANRTVVYIHYEEADPSSTIERLQMLGVGNETLSERLIFVGPVEQVQADRLAALLDT